MSRRFVLPILLVLAACGGGPALVDVRFDVRGRPAVIKAEVADTDAEQARGLMKRESLPADRGMLFVFPDAKPRQFYMKDTLIPLDLIAIREGRVVGLYSMAVCPQPPHCPLDIAPSDAALEVNAGTAARLGITEGALVDAPYLR